MSVTLGCSFPAAVAGAASPVAASPVATRPAAPARTTVARDNRFSMATTQPASAHSGPIPAPIRFRHGRRHTGAALLRGGRGEPELHPGGQAVVRRPAVV